MSTNPSHDKGNAAELLDGEGENLAVRAFLLYYGGGNAACPIISMRAHLARSGFDGCWPAWAAAPNSSNLTKAGAQLWLRHLFSLERATPPSPSTAPTKCTCPSGLGSLAWPCPEHPPSTAPEVDELPAPPTLTRYLLDMIGEYGMARTDSVGQLEVQHRWEILIGGIKRYASEYGRALASRPAEVDDERLPPLPESKFCAWLLYGQVVNAFPHGMGDKSRWDHDGHWAAKGYARAPLYTAEQYRQGQRDAVAADRARRAAAGGGQ